MTPEEVTRACEDAIAACDAGVDAIVATTDGERTFANTLGALEAATDGVGQASGRYAFMAYVADNGDVRDAARASEERIDKYFVDLSFREDLFAAINAYAGARARRWRARRRGCLSTSCATIVGTASNCRRGSERRYGR